MRALTIVVSLLAAGLVALVLAPGIEPVSWQPPPVAPPSPATALNDRLSRVEWWAKQLLGPEAITLDAEGRLLTGTKDGQVVRLRPGSDAVEVLANTGGRPLALALHPDGRLYLCDATRGLLALGPGGQLEVLSTEEGGVPFRFVDDLAIAPDGAVYFTDASARHSIDQFTEDLLEHRSTGRLLKYEPASGRTTRVADGFAFANGVALSPDASFAVVSETAAYRLWRVWLTGPRAGAKEVFTDALPGFPDNVRLGRTRPVFWVAIGSPRKPAVDALAGLPLARKLISLLPRGLQPAPARHAYVLAVDLEGRPVESLQHDAPDSYSPVASAVEGADGYLYLSSFAREGVARLKL